MVFLKYLSKFAFLWVIIFYLPTQAYADWWQDRATVERVFELIDDNALNPVNLNNCKNEILGSISGIPPIVGNFTCLTAMQDVDRYFSVLNAEAFHNMQTNSGNNYVGIGVSITQNGEADGVIVVDFSLNSPAERAGIKRGDIIRKARQFGEEEAEDINSAEDTIQTLLGEPDTVVFVTIERNYELLSEIAVTRKMTHFATIIGAREVANGVGYVRVERFGLNTADELEEALLAFRRGDGTASKVIVDLRNNPGGDLVAPMEMLYYFSSNLDDILLTYRTRTKDVNYTIRLPFGECRVDLIGIGEEKRCPTFVYPGTQEYKVPGIFKNFHIVVLINKNSASASEIFTGALQDWGRHYGNFSVIGTNSYGKGIGQFFFNLPDGSFLRLTTFEFLVGNNRVQINGVGVIPNVIVEANDEGVYPFILPENDTQLQAAISLLLSE